MSNLHVFIDGGYLWKIVEAINIQVILSVFTAIENIAEIIMIDGDPNIYKNIIESHAQFNHQEEYLFRKQINDRLRWHEMCAKAGVQIELVGFKGSIRDCNLKQMGADTLLATKMTFALTKGHNIALLTGDGDFSDSIRSMFNELMQERIWSIPSIAIWGFNTTAFSSHLRRLDRFCSVVLRDLESVTQALIPSPIVSKSKY